MAAIFTKETNETTVEVAHKQEFIIELEENRTTGYSWKWMSTPGIVLLSTSFENSNNQAVGSSGVHRFVFTAIEKGTFQLDLRLKQLWEDDSVFTDRFSLTVHAN